MIEIDKKTLDKIRQYAISEMSFSDIAYKCHMSKPALREVSKKFNIKITPDHKEHGSRGSEKLFGILSELFPHYEILQEHSVGKRLRLDYYIPKLRIGIEFDGKQHSEFNPYFHGSRDGFAHSVASDQLKNELCEMNNITLVRISYKDEATLDKDFVCAAIDAAVRSE